MNLQLLSSVCLSLVTEDERRIREFKFKIDTEKELFNKKKTRFTSKLNLHLRKEIMTYYIRSVAFYGAETWTLRNIDQK